MIRMCQGKMPRIETSIKGEYGCDNCYESNVPRFILVKLVGRNIRFMYCDNCLRTKQKTQEFIVEKVITVV